MSDRSNAQEYDKLSDIRSEWWLAVEVYACLACGALVTDKATHDYWHNPTPRYVTDEDRNPDDDYEPLEWECADCGREEVSPNVSGWTIGHEGTRCPGCAANRRLTIERDAYRAALENCRSIAANAPAGTAPHFVPESVMHVVNVALEPMSDEPYDVDDEGCIPAIDAACAPLMEGLRVMSEDREALKAFMVEAAKQLATYRAALERIDQSPLGTDDFAMRVIAQQAIVAYDPEYPNNQRTTP